MGLIPGSGGSPGEGNSNPLQYSCLENSMDRGAWQATVHEGGHKKIEYDLVTQQQQMRDKPSSSGRHFLPFSAAC